MEYLSAARSIAAFCFLATGIAYGLWKEYDKAAFWIALSLVNHID